MNEKTEQELIVFLKSLSDERGRLYELSQAIAQKIAQIRGVSFVPEEIGKTPDAGLLGELKKELASITTARRLFEAIILELGNLL